MWHVPNPSSTNRRFVMPLAFTLLAVWGCGSPQREAPAASEVASLSVEDPVAQTSADPAPEADMAASQPAVEHADSQPSPSAPQPGEEGRMGTMGVDAGSGGLGEGVIGLGNLNPIGGAAETGFGNSTGGSGSGYGRPAHATRVSVNVNPNATGLPRPLVSRVFRRHVNEVRFCYQQEHRHDMTLSGQVHVRFEIGENGRVRASGVQRTTLSNERVEQCIVQATRRWSFPAHGQISRGTVVYNLTSDFAN